MHAPHAPMPPGCSASAALHAAASTVPAPPPLPLCPLQAGVLHFHGQGVPANYSEAARYFAMAADRDHDAAFNLATVYQAGAAGWGAQGGGACLGRRPGVSLWGWH